MSSTVNKINEVLTELKVTVPADKIKGIVDERLKKLTKTAKVRGFRKGKIPFGVAKRMFAPSLYIELVPDLSYEAFLAALKEHDIDSVGQPEFLDMPDSMKEGEDYTFSAKVEMAPNFDDLVLDGIEISKERIDVDESIIDNEIERMQGTLATFKEFEKPRKIKEGDSVKLEMRKQNEDKTWSETPMPDQEFVVKEGLCPKELLPMLPGKNLNDEFEVEFGADDNKMPFLCKVVDHKDRILPAIDDEMAKDVGDFETLADLKADISKKYVEYIEKGQKGNLQTQLFEALYEKNPREVPPSILAKQLESMQAQHDEAVDRVNKQIEKKNGKDSSEDNDKKPSKNEELEKSARNIVYSYFLIRGVAKKENITVTEEDMEKHYQDVSAATGLPVPRIKAEYANSDYRYEAESQILDDKVFDFLLKKVKIKEIEPQKKEADESTATKKSTTKKSTTKKSATKKSATKKSATKKSATKTEE